MESIFVILKNIRKLLPYFILIAIYFFFINLEARKDNNNRNSDKNNILPATKTSIDDQKFKIKIPVIPYNN